MSIEKNQSVLSKSRKSVLALWPPAKWAHTKILVAVSGGPDSVALIRVLLDLVQEFGSKNQLVMAHVNHMTRERESSQDQVFVEQLANKLNIDIEIERFDSEWDESPSELTLRNYRYEVLSSIAQRMGARYIATGHNRDDQIETILFRILRGTGISGLAGIPTFRDLGNGVTVFRPLISMPRCEILELLSELQQDYRIDSSNSNTEYTRNFIRNELIPLIQNRFGDSWGNGVLRLGAQADENQQLLDRLSLPIMAHMTVSAEQILIECSRLRGQSPTLIRHALVRTWQKLNWPLQSMSSLHWTELCESVCREDEVSPFMLPGNVRVERKGNRITVVRMKTRS